MVSLDTAERNREFAESLGADFPILSDPGGSVARLYGVLSESGSYALRHTVYIDRDGIVRHVDKKVNAAQHGSDIAAALARLGFLRR